jgi:hypothetical protein
MAKKTAKKRTAQKRTPRPPGGRRAAHRQARAQDRAQTRRRQDLPQAPRNPRSPRRRRSARNGRRPAARPQPGGARRPRRRRQSRQGPPPVARKAKTAKPKAEPGRRPAAGGNGEGRERTLAQTPEAGRTVKGRTNPMATRRSTGTPAGAGSTSVRPGLDRERRRLRELEETIPGPPSSLDTSDRMASAARTGRAEMRQARREHTETSPV